MKKIILNIVIIVTLFACVDEVALPVTVNFETEIVNNDITVPVRVKVTNNTEGADTYKWSFEGAIPNSSTSKNPGVITYEKEGEYIIKLEASNRDGSSEIKEHKVLVKSAVNIGFVATIIKDDFSPVEVKLTNTTIGATSYEWLFEGGNPASSVNQHPKNVVFKTPGLHKIVLKVSNGEEQYTTEETIEVKPHVASYFEYSVPFEDDDFQVPVQVTFNNRSVSATTYEWTFEGITPTSTSEESPKIEFTQPGTYTIKLKASNGKEEKVFSKTITVFENTNLKTFENIKLGINTAHKNNNIGAFFSAKTRQVYKNSEITDEIGKKIDIAFFGLNENFTFNKFVSPNKVQNLAFSMIPNATTTKFVNKLEACNCSVVLSVPEFDGMNTDSLLSVIKVEETEEGLKEFDKTILPRIIVFETSDKRKGAIKIKEFKKDGANSFITVDIKIQKEAK